MKKCKNRNLLNARVDLLLNVRKSDKQAIDELDDEEEEEPNESFEEEIFEESLEKTERIESIEDITPIISKRLTKKSEITNFNLNEEEFHFNKDENIIPNKEENDNDTPLGDSGESSDHEYELDHDSELNEISKALQIIISLMESDESNESNERTVLDVLRSLPEDSDEFQNITEAATTLIFTNHLDIYSMTLQETCELNEEILSQIPF